MKTPQSHTALENPPSQSTLEDLRMPVQAKLAAAWTSFMFLYIYVDYLALYKPGFVGAIRAGIVHGVDTGPTFVALASNCKDPKIAYPFHYTGPKPCEGGGGGGGRFGGGGRA